MKLTVVPMFLVLTFSGVGLALTSNSQAVLNKKVSVEVNDKEIGELLDKLETMTDVKFVYSPQVVKASDRITVTFKNARLGKVLESVFSPYNVVFEVVEKKIVLKKQNLGSVNEQPQGQSNNNRADTNVSGKVIDEGAQPLPGVNVVVKGTTNGTTTDANGLYNIVVPTGQENGTLVFSFIGYKVQEIAINGQSKIDIQLEPDVQSLQEVVVTGYMTQRKQDLVGAVAIVEPSELIRTPSADLTSQLQGRVSGVTVSGTGDPGASSQVRIRGFASYGNNNPLYIIDGVPTTDPARINPMDVASMQVLKDASSASIYGARAANGVIIITTKQGKPGKTVLSYDSYVGVQTIPFNRIPKLLNTAETVQYLERTSPDGYVDPLFGTKGSFSIPEMYIVSRDFKGGVSASDPRTDPDLYTIEDYSNTYQIFETSAGTDWFRAMSQNAVIQSHQINASGGTETSQFSLGLNYFDQEGVFRYTGYDRYQARVNSSFDIAKFLKVGENLQIAYDRRTGDNTAVGEQSAWANSYRSSPYIPVYDIENGYGGSLIGSTSGIGNNPVAYLTRRKDWTRNSLRAFGNVFAEIKFSKSLTARTSLGVDLTNIAAKSALLREYERTEPRSVTQLTEGSQNFSSLTWTNTLVYSPELGKAHNLKVLVGSESIKNEASGITVVLNNFDLESDDFLSLNTGLPQSLADVAVSNPVLGSTALLSYFARADYGLNDKYILNATFRRDGSSLFAPGARYGNFASVGLGWRISGEEFMQGVSAIDELKLRAGWGIMGSISNVPILNQYSAFQSNPTNNSYDINGGTTGSTQGYGISRQGNTETQWETTRTINVGVDLALFGGAWTMALDVYDRDTRDLLVPSLRNGMEQLYTKPLINLGTMNNKGVDLQIGHQGKISEFNYNASLTFSAYRNELTKLNDENTTLYVSAARLPNAMVTTKGEAVSSFNGYIIDGFYNSQSDVDNGPTIQGLPAPIGSWKFADLNGDGNITAADQSIIGSPHPDFQLGLNLGVEWKGFDFNTFLFWNQGNEIFNYNKYFTYMGVLGGGIAREKLYDAWTPETASSAKVPSLGSGSSNGYTSFVTSNPSSFYIEDGSYFRVRTMQLGYTVPASLLANAGITNLRVYVQGQNLWTATNYSGADPDLGLVSASGMAVGSAIATPARNDQSIGVDYSGFPTPRQFLIGLNLSF